ncbi:SMC-Scp complex subunit ScpB [Chenggangzhangella methanolivorans]|uniref:SMC-Scp complex subunit ScpB n=1 Tax=Chenggangzhangella methanolivorans TaxID=1437009 RepID=A0A9E6R8X7_9HYPH|nr:SMC-Scp complex subunit ScpB [Chenggangzhangella methanolivorans]QZN99979.1 SMC-Scp complex subunit ScpB [Chenggangzhangella methanolivorans]
MSEEEPTFPGPGFDGRLTPEDRARAPLDHLRLVEAVLFASQAPVEERALAARLPVDADLRLLMRVLVEDYAARGVNLRRVGDAWAFRTAPDVAAALSGEAREPRKLSRAAIETLAIIAYHQPATRAEIEEIRGVATSRGTLETLLEAGFVRFRGRRRAPGRPVTFGTTAGFLDHFGLEKVSDLPGLSEMKAAGLLDARLPPGLEMPPPVDDESLRDDEEPLGDGDPFSGELPSGGEEER